MRNSLITLIKLCLSYIRLRALKLPTGDYVRKVSDVKKLYGEISEATLLSPAFITTPAGKLKFKDYISFHESGKLEGGTLAERRKINGKIYYSVTGVGIGWDEQGGFMGEMAWSDEKHKYVLVDKKI